VDGAEQLNVGWVAIIFRRQRDFDLGSGEGLGKAGPVVGDVDQALFSGWNGA
jgi:hypothetical protein